MTASLSPYRLNQGIELLRQCRSAGLNNSCRARPTQLYATEVR